MVGKIGSRGEGKGSHCLAFRREKKERAAILGKRKRVPKERKRVIKNKKKEERAFDFG